MRTSAKRMEVDGRKVSRFGKLVGLPDTRRDLRPYQVRSVTAAMKIARQGSPLIASGFEGSLHMWRDDKGRLRAQFYRYLGLKSAPIFTTLKDAHEWLREWWPKLESI